MNHSNINIHRRLDTILCRLAHHAVTDDLDQRAGFDLDDVLETRSGSEIVRALRALDADRGQLLEVIHLLVNTVKRRNTDLDEAYAQLDEV